jgi:ankyrin repeat protein
MRRCRAIRDAVKALLKQAADVNGAQGDGMTALHWAAMKNDAELATDAAVRRRQRPRENSAW